MSSGAQIFLVSACSSGEDFVAAFRRYVDRNGVVFVPIAEPLPAGRRGRFALTLSDGGVMVEGQAEVVSSARTPSVLHGRVGMTVKFVSPDDPSKTVLAELEKARLALKPSAPSVPPRSADVPSSPRPVPPPAGGRIDSVNALAECVVCGDAGLLSRDSDLLGVPPMTSSGSGPVVAPGIARPAKQSVPPPIPRPPGHTSPPPRAKPPSMPPPIPATAGSVGKATTLGLPALDRKPASPIDLLTTMRGPAPGVTIPADVTATETVDVAETLRGTMPPHVAAAIEHAKAAKAAAQAAPASAPASYPAPLPIAPPPPIIAGIDESDEKTDLSDIPAPPRTPSSPLDIPEPPPSFADGDDGLRDTAAMPAIMEPVDPLAATASVPSIKDNAGITPVVEEASGDWTMTPGDVEPTPVPRAKEPPKTAPTGDWLIQIDPSRPDGWSEPSKVAKPPEGELPAGPPVSSVAGETPLDSSARSQPEPLVDDGPKIQIDASLSDVPIADDSVPPGADEPRLSGAMPLPPPPLTAMPPLTRPESIPFGAHVSAVATLPGVGPVTPPPRSALQGDQARLDPTDLRSGFFRESGDIQNLSGLHVTHDAAAAKRRRTIIIGAAVGGTLLIVIVLAAVLSGGKPAPSPTPAPVVSPTAPADTTTPPPSTTPTTPTTAPAATADAAPIPPPTDHPLVADEPTPPPPETPPPAKTDCPVKITSVPSAAQVLRGKEVLGTTPFQITLPCGSKQELVLKKSKFATTTRRFTVKDNGKPVRLTLDKILFGVRVTSTPPRATVTLNGKNLGITPATVRIPAFETSSIKIELAGYTPEVTKVTPKENNKLHLSVVLKKAARAPAPKKR